MNDLDLKTIRDDLKQYRQSRTLKKILLAILITVIVIELLRKLIKKSNENN